MRRVLVSLLAILYLAAGAGFTLRAHYCMGKMIGATIEHPAHHSGTHRCDRCGMEKRGNKGCCKDEIKTFKASPEQTLVKAFSFQPPLMVADVAPAYPLVAESASFYAAIAAAPAHGPPPRSNLPVYLRVRCLRI